MRHKEFDAVAPALFAKIRPGQDRRTVNDATTELLQLCERYAEGCASRGELYKQQEYKEIAYLTCEAVVKKLLAGEDIDKPAGYVSVTMANFAKVRFGHKQLFTFTDAEGTVSGPHDQARRAERKYWQDYIADTNAADPADITDAQKASPASMAELSPLASRLLHRAIDKLQHSETRHTKKRAAYQLVLEEYFFGAMDSYLKTLQAAHPEINRATLKRTCSDGAAKLKETLRKNGTAILDEVLAEKSGSIVVEMRRGDDADLLAPMMKKISTEQGLRALYIDMVMEKIGQMESCRMHTSLQPDRGTGRKSRVSGFNSPA